MIMSNRNYEYPEIFEPIEGEIYVNRNGISYLCNAAEYDENGRYTRQAEFVSRSGWYLTADCPRQYKDGKIEWDSSHQGYFIPKENAERMFSSAELKKSSITIDIIVNK